MGVEDTTKTDTRTDATDKPASSERPYSPPPDNPGSPGQPSRLESLARAREQQQRRAQETQDKDKDTGSPPREDRDAKATTEQAGSGNEKTETPAKPEAEAEEQREDDDKPGTDQPEQRDKREEEPRDRDEGTTDAREPHSGTTGDRDRPQAQSAEQRTDTRTDPADKPASSERRWTPPPDNPGSPGQPSRLESLARAREQQESRAREQQEGTAQQSDGTDAGARPTQQHDNQPAPTQPDNDGTEAESAGKPGDVGGEHGAGERSSPLEAAETRDGSGSEGPKASEDAEGPGTGPGNGPGNGEPVRETPRSGESGEAAADAPGGADGPGVRGGHEDNVEPATAGRPRAESIARAIERQKARAEEANAPESEAPRPLDARAGVRQEDEPGTGDWPDGGEVDGPQSGGDRTGAEAIEDGEPSEAGASERTDSEGEQAARPDGPGRHPNPENPGATDDAEPAAGEREPVATEAREARPETDGAEAADDTEGGDSASPEEPDRNQATPESVGQHDNDRGQTADDSGNREDRESNTESTDSLNEVDDQRNLGRELAELADRKVDTEIDEALDKVNPKFDWKKSAYSENCTSVVQAKELRRRGFDVEAGPLEKSLRTDEGGPGGRPLSAIEGTWGRRFVSGTKVEIEEAFRQPGSRGTVYIAWNGTGGGAHVFDVENVGGKVRFSDGQPTPPVRDASHYFAAGHDTKYLRLDDRSTPTHNTTQRFLEPPYTQSQTKGKP